MNLATLQFGFTFYPFDWVVIAMDIEPTHYWFKIGPLVFDIAWDD